MFQQLKLLKHYINSLSLTLKNLGINIITLDDPGKLKDYIQNFIPMSEQIYTSKKNVKYILEINSLKLFELCLVKKLFI